MIQAACAGGADFLSAIDWSRPWLEALLPCARRVLAEADWRAALNEAAAAAALCNHRGLPIRFVPQEDLPRSVAYESFIDATGMVPTRSNLHDFFNALIWLRFPEIKRALNRLQGAEIAQAEAQGLHSRGRLRDAATIFDENAALVVTFDKAWVQALRDRHWRDALLDDRDRFGNKVQVTLFGHALLEKLVSPYKAITAHAWVVPVTPAFFSRPPESQCAWLDSIVSRQITGGFSTQEFTPLPVLGVPGWFPGQDVGFYADETVFRPFRK